MDDSMQVGSYTLQGVRTFILTLVALIGYIIMCYSNVDANSIAGMKELAMIGFTFFFVKTINNNI